MAGLSYTPGGGAIRCPICGGDVFLELVEPVGVALCPRCGLLLRRICGKLGVFEGQVDLSTSLVEDLGLDSLDLVEVVMELEQEFGITIPEDRAEKIKTIGDAIATIESLAERAH
jgi:acyl carrier protein